MTQVYQSTVILRVFGIFGAFQQIPRYTKFFYTEPMLQSRENHSCSSKNSVYMSIIIYILFILIIHHSNLIQSHIQKNIEKFISNFALFGLFLSSF